MDQKRPSAPPLAALRRAANIAELLRRRQSQHDRQKNNAATRPQPEPRDDAGRRAVRSPMAPRSPSKMRARPQSRRWRASTVLAAFVVLVGGLQLLAVARARSPSTPSPPDVDVLELELPRGAPPSRGRADANRAFSRRRRRQSRFVAGAATWASTARTARSATRRRAPAAARPRATTRRPARRTFAARTRL